MPTRKTEARWIESRERWQVNVTNNGERKTFACSTPGRKGKIECEKKADKWLASQNVGDIKFSELWDRYLRHLEKSNKLGKEAEHYIKHEQIGRVWLIPKLGSKRLSRITKNDWQEPVTDAYIAGRSKRTCANIRASMTAVYTFAEDSGYELKQPRVKVPKDAPTKPKVILQPDQLKFLFSVDTITRYGKPVPCFYIHAWRFLVATGLRRGEMCGIKQADIVDGVLHIRRSVNRKGNVTAGKTENAQRVFPLSNLALRVLDDQRAMLKECGIISPYVFPSREGNISDSNAVYKQWLTYRTQHGIESNLHELRHTMISVLKADVPMELLKRVVGHSQKMDTFAVYGHAVDGELDRANGIINDVFGRIFDEKK